MPRINLAPITSALTLDTRGFDKDLASSSERVRSAAGKMAAAGGVLSATVTAPLLAAATASLKLASAANESSDKVRDVFGSARGAVDDLANSYQVLNKGAALDLLGTTGNIITAMGVSRDEAAKMSVRVGELARDFSSFNDIAPQETFLAINAALTGEREQLKRLGIVLREKDVQDRALLETGKANVKLLTDQDKVMASLALITERGANQIGNFASTQDSLANQTRILRADVGNLAIEMGSVLLPAAKELVGAVRAVVMWFRELSPEGKKLTVLIAGMAAALGPVLIALAALTASVAALVPVIAVVFSPVGLLTAAVVGLGVAIAALLLKVDAFRDSIGIALGAAFNIMSGLFAAAKAGITGDWDTMWAQLQIVGAEMSKAILDIVIRMISGMKSQFGALGGFFDGLLRRLADGRNNLDEFQRNIREGLDFKETIRNANRDLNEFVDNIREGKVAAGEGAAATGDLDRQLQALNKTGKDSRETFAQIRDEFKKAAEEAGKTEVEMFELRLERAKGNEALIGEITAYRDYIETIKATTEATKEQKEAQEELKKKRDEVQEGIQALRDELELERVKITEGTDAFRLRKLELEGLTPKEAAETLALQDQLQALKDNQMAHAEWMGALKGLFSDFFDNKLGGWLGKWGGFLRTALQLLGEWSQGVGGLLNTVTGWLNKLFGGGGGLSLPGLPGGIVNSLPALLGLGGAAGGAAAGGAAAGSGTLLFGGAGGGAAAAGGGGFLAGAGGLLSAAAPFAVAGLAAFGISKLIGGLFSEKTPLEKHLAFFRQSDIQRQDFINKTGVDPLTIGSVEEFTRLLNIASRQAGDRVTSAGGLDFGPLDLLPSTRARMSGTSIPMTFGGRTIGTMEVDPRQFMNVILPELVRETQLSGVIPD